MTDEPAGYLRRYDDDLEGALALVIADAQTTGLSSERVNTMVWELAQHYIDFGRPQAAGGEIALVVAERMQEAVMEELGVVPWPPCPDHPDTHPLWLRVSDGPRASWTCEVSGRRIELGRLVLV